MAYNPTISEREFAAGLNLAGNNTMSGRGLRNPTMDEREAAAGLNLAGNSTTDPEFQNQNFIKYVSKYIEGQASLIRQDASRARRSAEKRLKDKYQQAINNANNTRDKRELKKCAKKRLRAC